MRNPQARYAVIGLAGAMLIVAAQFQPDVTIQRIDYVIGGLMFLRCLNRLPDL